MIGFFRLIAGCAVLIVIQGCTAIPQKDRGSLSDPVMQLSDDPVEARDEAHNFPRREGSSGGAAGAGGGCGC